MSRDYVEISDLHKSFVVNNKKIEAVKGVNIQVKKGEVCFIVGPSGSGKSTMLRCVNLLESPEKGTIFVDEEEITGHKANINRIREEIGMVFQSFNLFSHLNVLKNISLAPIKIKKESPKEVHEFALYLLDKVGLSDKADAFPAELSGGQQQRVAIARSLAMRPKLMLFDEPTSALDPEMIKEVLNVMVALANEGMTMIVVSHEMGFAKTAAHKVCFMDQGTVVEEAAPKEFFDNTQTQRAKDFLSHIL